MSKLFLFALLLIGCASTPVQPVAPKEDPIPVIIARGTDGKVSWKCQVEEMNDKLVWVPCEFHNEKTSLNSSCITVTFYDQLTMKPVVESRKICSGPLAPNDFKMNYAAFIKDKRATLQRCGELLDLCVMLAGKSE